MNRTVPLLPDAPVARILCSDERMFRFFEIELAHLGLAATASPSAAHRLCLAVADTDEHPVEALLAGTLPPDCPLLAFGREPAVLPEGRGIWLHRPFSLTALEAALRRLSADAVSTASPLTRPRADQPSAPAADGAPLLRMASDAEAVTVGEHRVLLTPAEGALLRRLYARRGETVSREELDALLGGGGNSVEVYICRLRRKMEKPLGRRLIRTVRGQGYCLD